MQQIQLSKVSQTSTTILQTEKNRKTEQTEQTEKQNKQNKKNKQNKQNKQEQLPSNTVTSSFVQFNCSTPGAALLYWRGDIGKRMLRINVVTKDNVGRGKQRNVVRKNRNVPRKK